MRPSTVYLFSEEPDLDHLSNPGDVADLPGLVAKIDVRITSQYYSAIKSWHHGYSARYPDASVVEVLGHHVTQDTLRAVFKFLTKYGHIRPSNVLEHDVA